MPTCDLFLRSVNSSEYDRHHPPMISEVSPDRRVVVNELAFCLLGRVAKKTKGGQPAEIDAKDMQECYGLAQRRVLMGDRPSVDGELNEAERNDSLEQYRRLVEILGGASLSRLIMEPAFPGCGILDSCTGDVISGATLYEIKAGERYFRSVDVRQVITYAALNYSAQKHSIRRVGLINPRMGVGFEMDIEGICQEAAGKSANALLSEIVHHLSSGELSR